MILQPTSRVERGRPIVQLYGRLDAGPAFLVEDDRFRPYCFVLCDAESCLAPERGLRVEPCGLRRGQSEIDRNLGGARSAATPSEQRQFGVRYRDPRFAER